MENMIYAGLRNPGRDIVLAGALNDECSNVKEVADSHCVSRAVVRAAKKRVDQLRVYDLSLSGGGQKIKVGKVMAKSFRRAALAAYRHYGGTFRNLELPDWQVTDGSKSLNVLELREIDQGKSSVSIDD